VWVVFGSASECRFLLLSGARECNTGVVCSVLCGMPERVRIMSRRSLALERLRGNPP
jgi:hypothetical protein